MVYTMPEFLERRFSTASRVHPLDHFAGAVHHLESGGRHLRRRRGVLRPVAELGLHIGTYHVDSFWIGSVMVLVLTGLYTMFGGMRAVVYTEALQTIILVIGSC